MTNIIAKKGMAIYVHIPFCEKKCLYCSFVSFADSTNQQAYFFALQKQIEKTDSVIINTSIITSVYFGGGTPSFANQEHICNVLLQLKNKFEFAPNCEISIECNPNSTTKEKLIAYKNAGFNRISFGVQSFIDDELIGVGRLHTALQAQQIINLASQLGFTNISVDLLLGIPFQTQESLLYSVKQALSLPITHISAYALILEENTPLFNSVKNFATTLASDDEVASWIEMLESTLETSNFNKYEVSSFCLSGYECNQNITYWECREYLGYGLAAHGYVNQMRIENTSSMPKFLRGEFVHQVLPVTITEQQEERIMLGLRMVKGINLNNYEQSFGTKLQQTKRAEIEMLEKQGLIKQNNNHLHLTNKGFFVSNQIILRLVM